MQVNLSDGTNLDADDEPFKEGAEGTIHASADGRFAIKLYRESDSMRARAANKIIGYWPSISQGMRGNFGGKHYFYAWPLGVGEANGSTCILMAMVDCRRFTGLDNLLWTRVSDRGISHLQRLLTALNMSRAARPLHSNGLAHSDFSFNNFLCDLSTGQITAIDLDGLVVPDLPYMSAKVIGTPKCMAPEIVSRKSSPTIDTDKHALAVLIYWTLLSRHPLEGRKFHDPDPCIDDFLAFGDRALFCEHPSDPTNRPHGRYVPSSILSTGLQKLFHRAFVNGLHAPADRPMAVDWEAELWWAIEQLVTCTNEKCVPKYFVLPSSGPLACPWCDTKQRGCFAVLNLYRQARRGTWTPAGGRVVRSHGTSLFSYHLRGMPPTVDDDLTAELVRFKVLVRNGRVAMDLENVSVDGLAYGPIDGAERVVPRGSSVTLFREGKLKLGPDTAAHVVVVLP